MARVLAEEGALRYIRLNPLVEWHRFGPDQALLQIRSPDGDHITFDKHVERIEHALQDLHAGVTSNSVCAMSPLEQELVRLLSNRSFLVEGEQIHGCEDWFQALAAFRKRRLETSGGEEPDTQVQLSIEGSGWIADCARAAAAQAAVLRVSRPRNISLVCTDVWDIEWLREENSRLVRDGRECSFIARDGPTLYIGPHVLPKQSSCFECFFTRYSANLLHPAEFASYTERVRRTRLVRQPSSKWAQGFVEFIALRHLIGITNEDTALSQPGRIEILNVLSLHRREAAVLRLPFCAVCGSRRDKPRQAIRNLI